MNLNYLQNKCIKTAIAAVLLCISSFGGYAQNSATEGKDFYLVFGKNAYSPTCKIRYVVTKTCYITAQYKDGTYIDNNVQYTPGTYEKTVDLTKCYISTTLSSTVMDKGIRVTATENISLYAINLASLSTDATTVLPVSNLGNDYTVISHDTDNSIARIARIAVVATANNTVVTIKNSAGTTVSSASLSAGEVYCYVESAANGSAPSINLTGYTVESNYNVAVFSMVDCGKQDPNGGCDVNFEQMWPANTAGKNFFIWNISPSDNDKVVILALDDATNITVKVGANSTPVYLNKHKTYTFRTSHADVFTNNSTAPVKIESNKPVIVNQILGRAPSIKWWSPVEQRVTSSILAPFQDDSIRNHTLHVMIPAGAQTGMTVRETRNGVTQDVPLTFYTNTSNPDFVIAKKDYAPADADVVIELMNPSGFIAYMHGIGIFISYIYSAGAGAFDLQSYFTVRTKTLPYNDVYYSATDESLHTFEGSDNIIVKRTVEKPFTSIKWLINGSQYGVAENTDVGNTLNFPASELACGENTISMSVRYTGASADSVYTGKVWRYKPDAPTVNAVAALCAGATFSITVRSPKSGYYYKVYEVETNGTPLSASAQGSGTISGLAAPAGGTTYYVSATDPTGCESERTPVTVTVNAVAEPDNITADDVTICYNTIPKLTANSTIPNATFRWYDTQTSTDILKTDDVFSAPSPLTASRSYYVSVSGTDTCENEPGNRKEVVVTVLSQSVLNYPDLRIWACPGAAGEKINLSKYIDTLALKSLEWRDSSGALIADGILDADKLVAPATYTYTYKVSNACITADITRKAYMKVLNNDRLKPPRDTIAICHQQAEAVQINQIFGIDAGGTWDYYSDDGDIDSYVTEVSSSSNYSGAVVMNGKGIYEDSSIGSYIWRGISAKRVAFTYTPSPTSCLGGKKYKTVIILY